MKSSCTGVYGNFCINGRIQIPTIWIRVDPDPILYNTECGKKVQRNRRKIIDRERELVGKIARKSDTIRDMEKKESVEESDMYIQRKIAR